MSWQNRLLQATYVSSQGKEVLFYYEDVRKEFEKKTSLFTFPDKDGAYIQDFGTGARKFPLRIFFFGDDYDKEAKIFEAALNDKGPGKLIHPAYGVFKVIPFGAIVRRDGLVTKANQAVFDVVFYETIVDISFPDGNINTEQNINNNLNDYQDTAAGEFGEGLDVETVSEEFDLIEAATGVVNTVTGFLQGITEATQSINTRFETVTASINTGVSDIINAPIAIASSLIILTRLPSRVITNVEQKIDGYTNVINTLIETITPTNDNSAKNKYYINNLAAVAALNAAAEAAVFNAFSTSDDSIKITLKTDVLNVVDSLISLEAILSFWQDETLKSLGITDTGETYNITKKIQAETTANLIALSFNLRQERRFFTSRKRSPIVLVSELYRDLDQLDFFISSNNLTGDEILEIPKGREIVYYK